MNASYKCYDHISAHKKNLSLSLMRTQYHNYKHSKSCFKPNGRVGKKTCRYLFPKHREPTTRFDNASQRVVMQRSLGNEYINPYIPILAKCFKFNHDCKVLMAIPGTTIVYYVIKYVSKPQKEIENMKTFILHAFDKSEKFTTARPLLTDVQIGGYLQRSMLNSFTNPIETGAPLCSLYLLQGSPFWFSHPYATLHIHTAISQFIDAQEVEVTFTIDRGDTSTVRTNSDLLDYIYRPILLEKLCFYEFFRLFSKTQGIFDLKSWSTFNN